jgi:hypothetical protein
MANPEQLEYLQDSADDWTIYRREFAITRLELMGADLSAAQLPSADLSGTTGLNRSERAWQNCYLLLHATLLSQAMRSYVK